MRRVSVIGAGFAGLSAASCLAKEGFEVTVFEKNALPGGRARNFSAQGFTFDMGPSWYWMPDVFEQYFSVFGKKPSDFYSLVRLDPSYRVYFGAQDHVDLPAGKENLMALFESMEPGSGVHLSRVLEEGKGIYDLAISKLVFQPGKSFLELIDPVLIFNLFKYPLLGPLSVYIRKHFKNPRLIDLLEFPVLFLGGLPSQMPSLYRMMNYADLELGTWYPMGGMYTLVEGMVELGKIHGATYKFGSPVDQLDIQGGKITGLWSGGGHYETDHVVATGDYHAMEQHLLPSAYRKYGAKYWDSRVLAPSALIFYLGLDKKIDGLLHHTLFFHEDFERHGREIFTDPQWPVSPRFYVSCPSKTDPSVAPEGGEALMVLVPVAPGLQDGEDIRERYFDYVMGAMEKIMGQSIRPHIVYKRSYAHQDFMDDYHAFKGNAYGLANTLMQMANFKPSMVNNRVKNLIFAGQMTVPGPGVPPCIISGQVAARELAMKYKD